MTPAEQRRLEIQNFVVQSFQKNRAIPVFYGLFFHNSEEEPIEDITNDITSVIERIGGTFIFVNCEGKTYKQVLFACLEQDADTRRIEDLYRELECKLQMGTHALILAKVSKMNARRRPGLARDFLKILRDAPMEIKPMSQIIFIDRTRFLNLASDKIGHLIEVMPPIDPGRASIGSAYNFGPSLV